MIDALLLIILFKAGGIPLVNYTIYVPQNTTIINVTLPVTPIPDTIEAINDSTGSLIPVSLYPGNVLSVFAFGGGYVSIVYYGNYTFNAESLLYSFNVESKENITIVFPPFIIPYKLPINIIYPPRVVNGSILIVVLQPGNYTIQYAYVPRSLLTATNTSTVSTSTTSTATTTTATATSSTTVSTTSTTVSSSTVTATVSSTPVTSTSTTTSQVTVTSSPSTTVTTVSSQSISQSSVTAISKSNVTPLYLVIAVILIVVVSVVVFLSRRRALEAFEQHNLDEVDRLIISTLRQYGGSLYQSQLQQLTNIPKTTLWRHVMKLKDMGIVRVDKVNGLNKVTLISG
ncbi:helix-turn-helix transcriptional regulator [Caldivirga maquilingensis]|uniref:helix-turn-helix transcriptional regulator n=1 Tax=Caldivirga maquilingensis TaxID=76887 RepID=UPI00064EBB9D|nr:winged helix-turn-helix transcriptional regulator [Caldivirga maquilingensis]